MIRHYSNVYIINRKNRQKLSIYLFIYLSIYLSIYLYLYEHLDLHVVLGVPVVGVVGAEGVVPLGGVAHLNTGDLRSLKYILK